MGRECDLGDFLTVAWVVVTNRIICIFQNRGRPIVDFTETDNQVGQLVVFTIDTE